VSTKLAYSLLEAADATGLSEDSLKQAIRRGDLKAKRSARSEDGDGVGKYILTASALNAWLDGLADA
jgi:hypothetical protein